MSTLDAISIARLQMVMPSLAEKFERIVSMLTADDPVRVTQGLRSWQEQDNLFAIGRIVAGSPCTHNGVQRPIGTCTEHPLGLRVTNARGGYSYHNFGLALDAVPSKFGPDQPYSPDWDASHPTWKDMEAKAQSVGLDCGALWRTFPDNPHFQLTGRFPEGAPSDEMRQIFKDGGQSAVWAEVMASLQ